MLTSNQPERVRLLQPDIRPFTNVTAVPSSLTEAQEELAKVRLDGALIQAQLASRPRPAGVSPNELRDWREWHARAAGAFQYKSARSQFLNNWIKTNKADTPVTQKTAVANRVLPVILHMAVLLDEILGDETDDLSEGALLALREMHAWMADTRSYLRDSTQNGVTDEALQKIT